MFDFSYINSYYWEALYRTKYEVDIGVDAFNLLNENQETSLDDTKKKFANKVEKDEDLKAINPEYRSSYFSQIYGIDLETINELRRSQSYALCLVVFSFFETRLKNVCVEIASQFDLVKRLDNIGEPNEIKKCWQFLTKIYGVNKAGLESHYTRIKQQQEARNLIAHSNGMGKIERMDKISPAPGLKLIKSDIEFLIDFEGSKYISFLIDTLKTFLTELIKSIDDRYRELKEPNARGMTISKYNTKSNS